MKSRASHWFAILLATVLPACAVIAGHKVPQSTDTQGPFTLTFEATAASYPENEPVIAIAKLSYDGPEAAAELSGTGSGAILFDIEQLDGDLDQSAFQHDDCKPYTLPADQPIQRPFSKSGAFDATDPGAKFWRDFFADPELRLPVGRYRLTARIPLSVGAGCPNQPLDLSTSLDIKVVKQ